jgi:hypothetical protein
MFSKLAGVKSRQAVEAAQSRLLSRGEASCTDKPLWAAPAVELVGRRLSVRRELERARRKRDKFVLPKGLEPVKSTRVKRDTPKPSKQPQLAMLDIVDDDDSAIIAGELVEGDGKGKVLFQESEFTGEFNFRDSILEQLERYWVYIERMRKHDPESYGFYKKLGAAIVPYAMTQACLKLRPHKDFTPEELEKYRSDIKLPPWFKQHRPGFGCVVVGADPLTEKKELEERFDNPDKRLCLPKFAYFVKYDKPPPEIQPMADGDTYKLTIWWDKPQDPTMKGQFRKWGAPEDIAIFINREGTKIQALRCCKTEMVRVGKRGNNRRYELIPSRNWRIPEIYVKWAKSFGLDPQTHLCHIFAMVVNEFEHTNLAMARVAVSKGDLTAAFGLDPKRCAYFFQDRDIELTIDGRKKRVFHFVAPHRRADGTLVKAHFRGAREFEWAGYRVLITVPGLHHLVLPEFNIGMSDEYWLQDAKDAVGQSEIGGALARAVRGEPLRQALEEMHAHNLSQRH